MYITLIMSLHYLVKLEYLKTYNIYKWANFVSYLIKMLNISYITCKCQKGLHIGAFVLAQ